MSAIKEQNDINARIADVKERMEFYRRYADPSAGNERYFIHAAWGLGAMKLYQEELSSLEERLAAVNRTIYHQTVGKQKKLD